jgi:hypothetical protein
VGPKAPLRPMCILAREAAHNPYPTILKRLIENSRLAGDVSAKPCE